MATAGRIVAELTAKTQRFDSRMKRSQRITRGFSVGVGRMAKRLVQFGAVAAAAAVAGLTLMVRHQLKAIDNLAKLSKNLGVAVAELQAFHLAAGLAGVESDKFDKALKRMVKSVADAQNGLSTQVRAFDALGLRIEDLKGKKPDELFRIIADAVQRVGQSTESTAAIMDIFGTRVGADLVSLLARGSAGLDEARQLIDDLGLSLSQVDAANVEAANDAWLTFKTILDSVAKKFTVELAPFMTAAIDALIDWGTEGKNAGDTITDVMSSVVAVAAGVARAAEGAMVAWQAMHVVFLKVQKDLADIALRAVELSGKRYGDPEYLVAAERFLKLEGDLRAAQKALADGFDDLGADDWAERIKQAYEDIKAAAQDLPAGAGGGLPDELNAIAEAAEAAAKRMAKLKSAAESIFDATRTPLEQFAKKMEQLKELFAEKLIDEDTFKRAVDAAQKILDDATKEKIVKPEKEKQVGEFRQVNLRRIDTTGGKRGGKSIIEKLNEKQAKILEQIREGIERMRDDPLTFRFD